MLARRTPEAADDCWQAKRAAALVVGVAKTQAWEEFGEAMEADLWSALKKFWHTVMTASPNHNPQILKDCHNQPRPERDPQGSPVHYQHSPSGPSRAMVL